MSPLTVLALHNYYQQPGGEDQIFANETALLEGEGHRVLRYEDRNERIANGITAGFSAIWNSQSYRRIRETAVSNLPDIAHFHNTFPLISPSAYYAVRRAGVPTVQQLSNFRLLCPGGLFLRNGKPCEDCVEQETLRPALEHKCYRGSRLATLAVAGMLGVHRAIGTWLRMIDVYVAQSNFARGKFIAGGLPEDRIVVKANFVAPDPGAGGGRGGYALLVGRLSEEKGIETLIEAWRRLPDISLMVAGSGPLSSIVWPEGVDYVGHPTRRGVLDLMKNARVLIFPSICYENAPLTILEAFACGLPVIASNIGSIPEFVSDGRTGFLFRAGDPEDLAGTVRRAFDHPDDLAAFRYAAREEYLEKYTAAQGYRALMETYHRAIESAARWQRARRIPAYS